MVNVYFILLFVVNEFFLSYVFGILEWEVFKEMFKVMKVEQWDVFMIIGGKKIIIDIKIVMYFLYELKYILGYYYKGGLEYVNMAIDVVLEVKLAWEVMFWQECVVIFLCVVDFIFGFYCYKMNVVMMLGQFKIFYQFEIEVVVEIVDFFCFNVQYMIEMYEDQLLSEFEFVIWNWVEYWLLEGFVFVIMLFNFIVIVGNLFGVFVFFGNIVVWKFVEIQIYFVGLLMEVLEVVGLLDGVINLVLVDGLVVGDIIFEYKDFVGLYFIGSIKVF